MNRNTPLISIIIPFFNAEKTILRCLDSILLQDMSDLEVILVNDGSVDDSEGICRRLCENDRRFRIYSIPNSGPSSARNFGMGFATSDIVSFVDSDDYLERDYASSIVEAFRASPADVMFFGYKRIMDCGRYIECHIPPVCDADMFRKIALLSSQNMFGYTWIKAYRRSAIDGVRYDEQVWLFEDEIFTCDVLHNCSDIGIITKPLYNYVIGEEPSLNSRVFYDYCKKRDGIFSAWKRLLADRDGSELILRQIADEALRACRSHQSRNGLDPARFWGGIEDCAFFHYASDAESLKKAFLQKSLSLPDANTPTE